MNWFTKLFSGKGGRTIVQLKDPRGYCAARLWASPVWYDAWGEPYVYRHPDTKVYPLTLLPNGETEEFDEGPKWAHLRGPEIRFP